MTSSRRRIVLLAGVLGAAGLAVLVFRPAPVLVEVGTVARGPLRVTVDEEGETRVRERFVVAAPLAGRVERITLDAGDPVEPGLVVARMQPLPLDPRALAEGTARLEAAEAAKREADARVEQARAALEQARRAASRGRRLAAAGTISEEDLELAELDETTRRKELEAAIFAARAADYNVEAARAALLAPGGAGRTGGGRQEAESVVELRSPVEGSVLRVIEESERVVVAGTPLLELGNPSALEIVIDVLSVDAVLVQAGAPVIIEDWGGPEPLRARVRLVEPSGFTKISALGVEEQRVNVIADFVDDPRGLGDGYRLEARIVVWESADALKIPSSALFRHDANWSVFVVEGGRARRREITVGHRNTLEAEVRGAIAEGARVILHPSDLLDDGARVRPL